MTTIVYRDGLMAADTRAYSGNPTPIGNKQKIHRLPDGSIVGVSTVEPGMSEAFVAWLAAGGNPEEIEHLSDKLKLQAILVKSNGSVFYYCDNIMPSGPLFGPFFAIGSGDQYALGALSCGATADAAVMVAAQHDSYTGGEIMKLLLHEVDEVSNDNQMPEAEIVDAEVVEPPIKRKKRGQKA